MALIPTCFRCKLTADQIGEYVDAADEEGMTPDAYVCAEEGTYNPDTGHFACTLCFIAEGCPVSPTGWKAP
jgi:hypothetical protein